MSIFPRLASGEYIDIAYVAFFSNNTTAQTFIDNGGKASGKVYNHGNTLGYGLVLTNNASHDNTLAEDTIGGTEYIANGEWGSAAPADKTVTLNSGAEQTVHGALLRTNLVTPTLDENKKPVYTEATVTYLADYMEDTLPEDWQNEDGSYNLWRVTGDTMFAGDDSYDYVGRENGTRTLAQVLRLLIKDNMGTYAETKEKADAGNLTSYKQIESYFDAAYFLLNNTFTDSEGYGLTVPEYNTLNLVEKVKEDGTTYYTFNSAYDNADYNATTGVISNKQTTQITAREYSNGSAQYVRGNVQPENCFNPIADLGYGKSGSKYADYASKVNSEYQNDLDNYYSEVNYNLSLEGHAKFIYYEDDSLYFTFTGDDDVYLYINGIRVLDLGGAHAISKATISLNDVAELCGLKDGQAYDFDFYYMERHGTAANFGIETNIKIVDPAMTTTKTGYQNGVNTGYNGYVDPLVSVDYEFALQNNGEAKIEELTFTDSDIDVSLTKDAITLNSETKIEDLSATVYAKDGSVKETVTAGELTEDKLKTLLSDGLEVGEKIIIYGFKYIIPAGKDTFTNTVYTTAVSYGDNNSKQNLNGMAEWKVQKREYSFQDYHVYEWVGKSVTLTKEELLKPIADVVGGFDSSKATIAVSSASGITTGTNVNTKAVLNSDGSITYTGTETGADTFYYKVTEDTVTAVIGVAVYSYDVADNTYVLDYGLAVELNGDEFGLMVNDTLELAVNPHATTASVTGIENATSNYGTFTWNAPSLKYTPNNIIDNTDSVQANVQVLESGTSELTKFTGIAMDEKVTTAPANVVYYEENFPGITYVSEGENEWIHYETVDENGNSVAGTEQSADQDSNYGSDPNYEEDATGESWSDGEVIDSTEFQLDTSDLDSLQASGIEELNEYLGYTSGVDSNGSVNALVVNETLEVMYFDFVGTGFEIVSRTTDEQYAVINIIVQKIGTVTNEETGEETTTYTTVMQKPVITESKGGDLYQVPVISITGLDRANYRVVVKAAGSTETTTRVLYIDGIRIYGPLSDGEALKYYNPEEYQAEFLEVKQLISDGKAIYADASETDDNLQLVTGTTLVEDASANAVLTTIENVSDYMKIGPNNEIYLDGNAATGMIAFFLTPDEDTPKSARTIEIGTHRKADSLSEDVGEVYMTYGSTAEDIIDGTNTYTISSGTEQYYTIDVNDLTLDNNGRYLVMIGTNGSENYGTTLALTSLKLSGYKISFAEPAIQTAAEEDTLSELSIVSEIVSVNAARKAETEEEEEVEEIPVNENLTINSAALKAAKVVSGKVATLTVKATVDAESIIVTDAEGNAVEATRLTTKNSGNVVTFTFIWTVTGSRGDILDYTVRVYDADGLASVNTETVSVTIK